MSSERTLVARLNFMSIHPTPHLLRSLSLSLVLSFLILSLTEWTTSRTFVPNSLFFYFVILNFPLLLGIHYDY